MPLPAGVPTFTLTAQFPPLSPGGTERAGSFTFTPVPPMLVAPDAVYLGVENATLNASGAFTKVLAANDAFGAPFVWRMDGDITGLPPFSVNLSIPGSAGTVNLGTVAELATLPPSYVVVLGPQGPAGSGGGSGTPSGTVVSGTAFGQSSAAGAGTAYSRGDHAHGTPAMPRLDQVGVPTTDVAMGGHKLTGLATGSAATDCAAFGQIPTAGTGAANFTAGNDPRLSDNRTPAGTAGGDLSGTYPSPTVAKLAGAAVSGTPSIGKVLTASSGTAASWQLPAGGGSSPATRKARIADDNFSGLPDAAAWTVVRTSAGTPLQCSIPAAAGDRIEYAPNFAYQSSTHFLDFVLLDSAGGPAVYASSGTSTPLSEGNILYYPSTSISHATSADDFTVGPGHIDGSGNVTIALAYVGTGAGKVYAYSLYPFKLRLKNIGPQPS